MSEKDAKYYYNKGIIYNEDGKYGLAVDNFKAALSLDPDSIEINFNLGVAHINKKEYLPAIECFKFVLEKSPDEVAALSNIALAYARNYEFASAINYYKKVLEINPDDTPTFKDLGDAYTKNRQYDEAIEYYQKFLKVHPTSFVVKESLNTAINLKKNFSGAEEQIDKKPEQPVKSVIIEESKSVEEYFNRAVDFVREQKFDDAIENLRNCLKINPNYPGAYELLNRLFKIKEKLSSLPPPKPTVQKNIVQPSPQKREEKQVKVPAFIDYKQFNEFYALGIAYYNAKNYTMALENFLKASTINPHDKSSKDYIIQLKSFMENK